MFSIAVHDNAWALISDGRRTIFFVNQSDAELFDRQIIETRIGKTQQPVIKASMLLGFERINLPKITQKITE
ncbi:hypothetical protein LBMAG20_07350 [Methylocystaceae bacterium]|jgi:hypothetical protein|nr:hypothetical protein LBMAG20_07350 [Methylocystaceae bacterium]